MGRRQAEGRDQDASCSDPTVVLEAVLVVYRVLGHGSSLALDDPEPLAVGEGAVELLSRERRRCRARPVARFESQPYVSDETYLFKWPKQR